MIDIIRMSSKGQIVVPKTLRDQLGIGTSSAFAVFSKEDMIVLKKVDLPDAKAVFEHLSEWGMAKAKEAGWKEDEVVERIHKGRQRSKSGL